MKNKKEEKKVELYKEIIDENNKSHTFCKTVTEKQAKLVFGMSEAAIYLEEVAKFYEEELKKVTCEKCKSVLRELIEENYNLATELVVAADKFVFMCDINGEFAEHIRMGK